MKNLSRVKAYQQKLYSALGIEWREDLFNDRWLITLYGQDWDKLAESGLIENDFCASCGNNELKSGYYRIPAFSYYKVRLPICDNCWEEKGYEEVAQAQEKFISKKRIGCTLFIIALIIIIWLLFLQCT